MRNGKGKHDSEYPGSIQETYKINTPTPLKGFGGLGHLWQLMAGNE